MNVRVDTLFRCVCTALVFLGIGACSKPSTPDASSTPPAPLVERRNADGSAGTEEILAARIVAAGIRATYRASFAGDRLVRIIETRSGESHRSQTGEYEFHGARLTRYAGDSLQDQGTIELELDLQGAVTLSRAGSGEVAEHEINAIRTRAQLLRSHALAQRSVQTHRTH